MEQKRYNAFFRVSLLTLLVMISWVFAGSVTFAGDPQTPDNTVTYTHNTLTWDAPTDANGVAELSIFGEPAEGETLPLISPTSGGTYWLRLNNHTFGSIGYSMYLYTDAPSDIPLKFQVTKTEDMVIPAATPAELEGKQIISVLGGTMERHSLKNFEIKWYWDSESDEADTLLGNEAALQDLVYTIHVLFAIEDNSSHITNISTSGVRILHRGFIAGYPDNTFRPESNISRAEVAAIFARLLVHGNESILSDTKTSFSDVDSNAWHAKYIAAMDNNNLFKGYPNGTFKPDDPISRAEVATICVRYYEASMNKKVTGAENPFPDVSFFHWARKNIAKAYKLGIVEGYPDNTFRPDQPITRAEVVTMVNRLLSRNPNEEHINEAHGNIVHFTDVTDPTYWAYYQIYEAAHDHQIYYVEDGKEIWLTTK